MGRSLYGHYLIAGLRVEPPSSTGTELDQRSAMSDPYSYSLDAKPVASDEGGRLGTNRRYADEVDRRMDANIIMRSGAP